MKNYRMLTVFINPEWNMAANYIVPERKLLFPPISASDSNFNPRNTNSIPVVKIFVYLDLNEKS
ncbi:MAG: hypothetical protein SRB2_03020 [Desulfobacteraceae bacterium Eth-SRB2]|nr:MAG: hypothetical protein SRB2_03020 [Desulfobacteraceae bacterium Eth-SRB2]